ncbi:MAG: UDP-N-acetylmuramate--L-alanine ligase, partial [Porticoccaceae bacterium]|nr:UDP-N-acetylmuramate--L-alanine ligase [Porticoccaceae bacterium]
SPEVIQRALKNFSGVSRRFEEVLNIENKLSKITYIDDYGHHPNEIKATLEAARVSWPDRKIILIFQPHRFSRTRDLFTDFVSVLSTVDILVLLDIYPAGEAPLTGINSEKLSQEVCNKSDCNSLYLADIKLIKKVLPNLMSNNDLIISQGAGDISKYTEKLKSIIQDVSNDQRY